MENKQNSAVIKRKIEEINNKIRVSTGEKQERLHREIAEIKFSINKLTAELEQKENEEQELYEEFQKLYSFRNKLQDELLINMQKSKGKIKSKEKKKGRCLL